VRQVLAYGVGADVLDRTPAEAGGELRQHGLEDESVLRQVAAVYLANGLQGQPSPATTAEYLDCSVPTTSRWVAAAKDARHLRVASRMRRLMASIDKRPDGRYRLRWREVPGGPQQAEHFDRKADALPEKAKIEHSLHTGSNVDPDAGRITFRDCAEAWRKIQVHRHSTEISVEHQLRTHVYPVIGHRPIGDIRTSVIQGLVRHLTDNLALSTTAVVYGRVVAVFR
jgi:hypothetical protein